MKLDKLRTLLEQFIETYSEELEDEVVDAGETLLETLEHLISKEEDESSDDDELFGRDEDLDDN